jgi:hypothetical protein
MVQVLSRTPVDQLVTADPADEHVRLSKNVYGSKNGENFTSDFRSLISLMGHANNADAFLSTTANRVVETLDAHGFFTGNHELWTEKYADISQRTDLIRRLVFELVLWEDEFIRPP